MRTTQRSTLTWTVLLMAVCGACVWAVEAKPEAKILARPFPLGDVRLLDGPFKKAMELAKAYLLKLDADRMLWPFHDRAGLPAKGERYGGWEQLDCVGHTSGHYLSACAMMVASTGDEELKRRVDYMVDEIAKVQAKHGNGYAGPVRTEVWENTFKGPGKVRNFGLGGGYVPWYVLHKTFAGLIDAYTYAGNRQALDVARKFAAWAKKGTDNLTDEQFQKMMQCEWGGMNESLANLYALTGDKDRGRPEWFTRYETNLVQLIKALRKDFDAPNAKFVCATLGQTNKDTAGGGEKAIIDAMFAIGDPAKHPELRSQTATVYAHPLSKGGSSSGQYGGNAETYMNVGEGMGKAMVELFKGSKK